MKKFLFALTTCSFLFASCSQEDLSTKGKEFTKTNLEKIAPMTAYDFDVPAGQVAIVLNNVNGDTIAVLPESVTLDIPVNMAKELKNQTRAGEGTVKVTYIPQEEIDPYEFGYTYYETVAFEDVEDCDYDYNDLIFHTKIEIKNGHTYIDIQPIAYGAKYDMELYVKGTIWHKNAKKFVQVNATEEPVLVCSNVRRDLFKDSSDEFINTDPEKDFYLYPFTHHLIDNPHIKINKNELMELTWFIKVYDKAGNQIGPKEGYASIPMTQRVANSVESGEVYYNNLYNAENIPFGMVFCDIYGYKAFDTTDKGSSKVYPCGRDWFFYPAEKVDIETVYPNFRSWLQYGDVAEFTWNNPVGQFINVAGDDNEFSLYEYNRADSSKKKISRKNPIGMSNRIK